MAFFSFSGRRGSKPASRPPAKSGGKPFDEDRLRLEREIAELTRKTEEAERLAAQKLREASAASAVTIKRPGVRQTRIFRAHGQRVTVNAQVVTAHVVKGLRRACKR